MAAASTYDLTSSHLSSTYPDRTLARRPPSVSSRSTVTRRHRSHRSHHGGSSYLPQNEFPLFSHTGDVEIVISADGQEKRYLLHRLILAQCSGFFEASTSEQWSRAQAQTGSAQIQNRGPAQMQGPGGGRNERGLAVIGEDSSQVLRSESGPKLFWRYELDWGNDTQDDEVPMLIQKPPQTSLFGADHAPRPPPVRNKPPSQSSSLFRSISAMQSAIHMPSAKPVTTPDSELIRDYDNLFRIFYNYPPALDPINITEAYIQCKTLVNLADMYDALDVVGPRIDHHLLQFQSRLWKQIAKYPPSYLKLGYLARSKSIFAEALIHVVGQWPQGAPQLRGVPDAVLELIEDKVADLDDLRARVESRLFRLTLTTSRGERVAPGNNYSDWMAVSLFRHWLAENTTPPPPPLPKNTVSQAVVAPGQQPGSRGNGQVVAPDASPLPTPLPVTPGRIFRLLGAGGSAYLGHDEVKRFLKLRPEEYSRDSLRRFERRTDELKGMAREAVRPLMRNYLELDLAGSGNAGAVGSGTGGLPYLTCTKLDEGDWPW